VALGVAIGVVATLELKATRPTPSALASESAVMAHRAALAHATYSPEVRHPVEVGAADEAHLVAWLSKRLGVQVRAPKLDDAGMSLVGGRLLPGESGPVAQFMYQSSNGRRLTLYVRQERSRNTETAFRYARENNVGVFYWIDRECGYAIASADLNRDELLKVADLVYKQLEP
jgi:anti-sigma factor RsiW